MYTTSYIAAHVVILVLNLSLVKIKVVVAVVDFQKYQVGLSSQFYLRPPPPPTFQRKTNSQVLAFTKLDTV